MPFLKPDFTKFFSDIANENTKIVKVIYRLGLRYYLVTVNNTVILHHPPVNEIYELYNSKIYKVQGNTISRLMFESIDHSFYYMQPNRQCPLCRSP
jgi:hypothetical protein